MPKVPEKCTRCGAPISWEEGASVVKCEFCGYKNRLKPDLSYIFASYLKLRNPKEIIRHPISIIILLLLIPLFLIINPKNAKEEKVKEEYWPTKNDLKELKKIHTERDGRKVIYPVDKIFKEMLEWKTVKFQRDIKQACIYRNSIKESLDLNNKKIKKSEFEFHIKMGDLNTVYNQTTYPDIPEDIRDEFSKFPSNLTDRLYYYPDYESIKRYRKQVVSNLKYIASTTGKTPSSYRDYFIKEKDWWWKNIQQPLYKIEFIQEQKLLAANVEVLRQSGYKDWKLYSRWDNLERGISDLYEYYRAKYREKGNRYAWYKDVYNFALKKGALQKSDFTERGMKYKNIPPVVNDICDS